MNNRIANSVDPDEMAHYEPSHLDLHCLQRHPHWSAGMKEYNPFQSGNPQKGNWQTRQMQINMLQNVASDQGQHFLH